LPAVHVARATADRPYNLRRGGRQDLENAVEVVRHDHEGIETNTRPDQRGSPPLFVDDEAALLQDHPAVENLSEQAFSLIRAHSHEVEPIPGIPIATQPDGTAVSEL
jgi:hypothetical protein